MTTFPKIGRSCPFKHRLSELMDGDFCRQCAKTVTDLTAMSDPEIAAFRAASAGRDVCISYKAPAPALMGAALAAALTLTPMAAVADEPGQPPQAGDPTAAETIAREPDGDEIVGVMIRTDDVSCDPRRLPEPIELSECRSAPLEYDRRRHDDRD